MSVCSRFNAKMFSIHTKLNEITIIMSLHIISQYQSSALYNLLCVGLTCRVTMETKPNNLTSHVGLTSKGRTQDISTCMFTFTST